MILLLVFAVQTFAQGPPGPPGPHGMPGIPGRFQGPCHPRCIGCRGPTVKDCISCVPNATKRNGQCICSNGVSTDNCQNQCAPICYGGCAAGGTSNCDCSSCISLYAYMDEDECCNCFSQFLGDECKACRFSNYVNTKYCCPVGCMACDYDDRQFQHSCIKCAPYYYMLGDSDVCVGYQPTGCVSNGHQWKCTETKALDITFPGKAPQKHVWKHHGIAIPEQGCVGSTEVIHWHVSLVGGYTPVRSFRMLLDVETPFETDDRGLFFDGIYDAVEINGITIALNGTFGSWIQPQETGTFLSRSKYTPKGYKKIYEITYDDTSNLFQFANYVDCSNCKVNMKLQKRGWMWFAVAFEYQIGLAQTTISIVENTRIGKTDMIQGRIIESFDDIKTQITDQYLFLGQNIKEDTPGESNWKGFVYSLQILNYPKTDFISEIDVGRNSSMPSGVVLGNCPGDHYSARGQCVPCNSGCEDGCDSYGVC